MSHPYHRLQPLRTGFRLNALAPSVVTIYRKAKNGRLVITGAVLPKSPVKFAFGTRTKRRS